MHKFYVMLVQFRHKSVQHFVLYKVSVGMMDELGLSLQVNTEGHPNITLVQYLHVDPSVGL